VEGKGLRKGKGRKEEKREEGKGEEFGPPQCSRQIDAYETYNESAQSRHLAEVFHVKSLK
jgi:hypothetical protein